MKIGSQVYARNSIEAVNMYCKAFGAEISFEIKDESKKSTWQTMAFNVYNIGSESAVQNAYDVLRDGNTVIDPLGPCDWNPYCSNLIDRFGVFWWIAI